jgi:hypothetical protein
VLAPSIACADGAWKSRALITKRSAQTRDILAAPSSAAVARPLADLLTELDISNPADVVVHRIASPPIAAHTSGALGEMSFGARSARVALLITLEEALVLIRSVLAMRTRSLSNGVGWRALEAGTTA